MPADSDRLWNVIDGIREDQSKTRADIAKIMTLLEGHCKDEDDIATEAKETRRVAYQAKARANTALAVITALGIPTAWMFIQELFGVLKVGGR